MYPHLFEFNTPWGGRITIASYGVMMMIGFLLSLYLLQRRAAKHGIAPEKIFNVAVAMVVFGVVGARVFYVIQFWNEGGFAENPFRLLRVDQGGLVFYGGLFGGLAGAVAAMLRQKMPAARTFGLIASVGPLGHAFGRMGCFLNGCCHGRPTDSWIGMRFSRLTTEGGLAGEWAGAVHPTQLYAVAYNLLIFAFLSWWLHRRGRPEELIGLYMVTYGIARFFNEFFRITEPVAMGMSIAQVISIPLVVAGAAAMIHYLHRPDPQCTYVD